MRKFVFAFVIMLLTGVTSFAQGPAEQRAASLSDKMIKELQLNQFQSRKLRALNLENAKKMVAFEEKFASNPAELDKCIKGVCKDRDVQLESLLSTAQYSQYYSSRKALVAHDKQYALQLEKRNGKVAKTLVSPSDEDAKRSFPKPEVAVVKPASSVNK
ncbi:hypothetical protein GU926_01040 [Nibribacter ruber]|uniref:DUF4168 domain-containing protein n=1 Tax=Nibribacter ruber TaxID=2698458 RepID=A0A6P1NQJ1_9BACT|nr:hypothetical protein [Nibribacter ruber]QHL86106.1 hypothetical protein GU926_01040 [Nibribacter ruber]